MRIRWWGSAAASVSMLGCATMGVHGEARSLLEPRESSTASTYVAGELIVKFAPDAVAAVERAREAGTLPQIGITSLDQLFHEYHVTEVKRLFPPRPAQPTDASSSSLDRIYLLRVDTPVDLLAVVQAFSQDPAVEYAEPNRLVTIQSPEPSVP